jgi:hypothetical protein
MVKESFELRGFARGGSRGQGQSHRLAAISARPGRGRDPLGVGPAYNSLTRSRAHGRPGGPADRPHDERSVQTEAPNSLNSLNSLAGRRVGERPAALVPGQPAQSQTEAANSLNSLNSLAGAGGAPSPDAEAQGEAQAGRARDPDRPGRPAGPERRSAVTHLPRRPGPAGQGATEPPTAPPWLSQAPAASERQEFLAGFRLSRRGNRLLQQGFSKRAIAEKLGISGSSVRRVSS